jgi:thermitase
MGNIWHACHRSLLKGEQMKKRLVAAVLPALMLVGIAPAFAASSGGSTVLVKFRPGTSASQQRSAEYAVGGERANRLDFIAVDVVRVHGDPNSAVAQLRRNPNVQFAEVNSQSKHILASAPNDPSYAAQQWNLNNTGQAGGKPDADIDAPEGWAAAYGTDALGNTLFPTTLNGPVIGIVDTGIDSSHPDLAGKLVACANALTTLGVVSSGRCSDDNGHGTHVSGIATARTNNGIGVAGTAPGSRIAMCKALNAGGVGFVADIAACMNWLRSQGVAVISMSIGGGASSTEQSAVTSIWNGGNGTLMVAAAGNDSNSTLEYPAAYPEVVSVASTTNTDGHSSFSNTNSDVEVAAPGSNVYSTYTNGVTHSYTSLSGTSMATPHAGGVAAMIKLKNPSFTAAQLRAALDAAVDDLGPAGRDVTFGFGRLNLAKAMGS